MKSVEFPEHFKQPKYDERSSCYVNAGEHHGVGKRQPVGSKEHSMKGAVPVGRIETLRVVPGYENKDK